MASIAPLTRREYRVAKDLRDVLTQALDEHADVFSTPSRMLLDERARALGDAMREYEQRGPVGRWLPPATATGERRLRPVVEEWLEEFQMHAELHLRDE